MKTLLVILTLSNNIAVPQQTFQVTEADCVSYIKDHSAIVESWKKVYKDRKVIFMCVEVKTKEE